MKKGIKNVLCLTIITLVAGFALGYVYDVTKEPIRIMEEKTKNDAYKKVFETASSFEEVQLNIDDINQSIEAASIESVICDGALRAFDESGSPVGYVINVTSMAGYGGDISISVGIADSGEVLGVEILSISETAGLGMKAKEDDFRNQFKNKNVAKFSYTKAEPTAEFEIEALSGATITTKAVTNAVNAAICTFGEIGGEQDA